MAVMDEFKEEREAMKHGTPKEKISYFVYYYKWHVLIAIAAIAMIVSFTVQIVSRTDNAIYVCMLNTLEKSFDGTGLDTAASDEFGAMFAEYAGIDTNQYKIYLDTSMKINYDLSDQDSMYSAQKYMTYLAAADMDVIVTDEDSLEQYSYQEDFYDLREILTPEQIEKYEPYFYYIDMATVAERNEIMDSADNLYTDYVLIAPDPRYPEAMEEPVPVGIYLDDCEKLRDYFYFRSDDVVACVFVNTQRLDTALQYIDFLMEE